MIHFSFVRFFCSSNFVVRPFWTASPSFLNYGPFVGPLTFVMKMKMKKKKRRRRHGCQIWNWEIGQSKHRNWPLQSSKMATNWPKNTAFLPLIYHFSKHFNKLAIWQPWEEEEVVGGGKKKRGRGGGRDGRWVSGKLGGPAGAAAKKKERKMCARWEWKLDETGVLDTPFMIRGTHPLIGIQHATERLWRKHLKLG